MRGQITLETIILIITAIIISSLIVVLLIKLTPRSSTQIPVFLDSISFNKNYSYVFLSTEITNPGSISFTYSKVNSSSSNKFSFANCTYTTSINGEYVNYTFEETPTCKFSPLLGNNIINLITYVSGNKLFSAKTYQTRFSYSVKSNLYNFSFSLNNSTQDYGNLAVATVNTNLIGYNYSLFINSSAVPNCQNISNPTCSFPVNQSSGIYAYNKFYTIIADFNNASYSGSKIYSFYVKS